MVKILTHNLDFNIKYLKFGISIKDNYLGCKNST